MDFAELAQARQFARHDEIRFTRALGAGLEHAPVALGGGHQRLALGDGEGTGFFAIHILASLHG